MMKTLRSPLMTQTNLRICAAANTAAFLNIPVIKTKPNFNYPRNNTSPSPVSMTVKATENLPRKQTVLQITKIKLQSESDQSKVGSSNLVFLGALTVGVALFVMGFDDDHKALAFGPEGPLVEEFWENMRRYGLYVLTVSTGVAYTLFQPILELLRNPISAILVIAIFGGSFYIVTQVLSAMVGVSDFSYDYSY
ncbi:hypothetical protein ACH5RR_017432 [Cinchona calisaya]|uniref:Uncharacterized protein ycf33 n=1 Tax=Cinchona calisaya TaxID=153742 RepID=A0ABD2ZIV4_9GENT